MSAEAGIEEIRVPTPALVGAGLLMLATIGLALTARLTGADTAAPVLPAVTQAVATRDLLFEAGERSTDLVVRDAASGAVVAAYEGMGGEGGFVRGALRGLQHLRARRGIAPAEPYRLAEWPGGRLTLQDRATGMIVEVNAFGASSVAGYRALLPPPTPGSPE